MIDQLQNHNIPHHHTTLFTIYTTSRILLELAVLPFDNAEISSSANPRTLTTLPAILDVLFKSPTLNTLLLVVAIFSMNDKLYW